MPRLTVRERRRRRVRPLSSVRVARQLEGRFWTNDLGLTFVSHIESDPKSMVGNYTITVSQLGRGRKPMDVLQGTLRPNYAGGYVELLRGDTTNMPFLPNGGRGKKAFQFFRPVLEHAIELAKLSRLRRIALRCTPALIPYYASFGFQLSRRKSTGSNVEMDLFL